MDELESAAALVGHRVGGYRVVLRKVKGYPYFPNFAGGPAMRQSSRKGRSRNINHGAVTNFN
jgi:hypothetical protein